jgi:hypothetical protein
MRGVLRTSLLPRQSRRAHAPQCTRRFGIEQARMCRRMNSRLHGVPPRSSPARTLCVEGVARRASGVSSLAQNPRRAVTIDIGAAGARDGLSRDLVSAARGSSHRSCLPRYANTLGADSRGAGIGLPRRRCVLGSRWALTRKRWVRGRTARTILTGRVSGGTTAPHIWHRNILSRVGSSPRGDRLPWRYADTTSLLALYNRARARVKRTPSRTRVCDCSKDPLHPGQHRSCVRNAPVLC